jgi:hypothetical protein
MEWDSKALEPISQTDEYGRLFYKCDTLDQDSNSSEPDDPNNRVPCTRAEANLISSETEGGRHRPVLDIDIPCQYVPSTTEGHGHLYFGNAMSWDTYEKLLTALKDAGIIQLGYWAKSLERKATFVRPPWIKKPEKKDVP